MKTHITAFTALLICFSCTTETTSSSTEGLHAWGEYHWASDNLAPEVYDKTRSSELTGQTSLLIDHWASLGTPLQPRMTTNRKAPVQVVEGFSTEWLGLAQIWIEDGHIVKGKVSMNTSYLLGDSRFADEALIHVLCQELGHVWGLGHNQTALDTCMNDCVTATTEAEWLECLNHPEGVTTNTHDAEQLLLAYDHEDVSPDAGTETSSGGPDCNARPNHPRCQNGIWIAVHSIPVWTPNLTGEH